MITRERHDMPLPPGQLDHRAVPLATWRAPDHENPDMRYPLASADRIGGGLVRTMERQGWFENVENADALREFVQESLVGLQHRRVDKNYITEERLPDDPADERIKRALLGAASPEELFTLFADHAELIKSLELAKLSHPFDFGAGKELDDAMADLLLASGGELLDDAPRFRMKQHRDDIPAATVLCKRDLMDFRTDTAIVRVVQRQYYTVFQGDGMHDEPNFDRLLKRPEKFPILAGKMQTYLDDGEDRSPYGWVQPQSTSYYAKYVSTSIPI